MKFFNFWEKLSKKETELEQDVRGEDELKKEIERIFKMRKHIAMDRIPADKVIEDKLNLDEAKVIEEIGEEKYRELLVKLEEDFGRNREKI